MPHCMPRGRAVREAGSETSTILPDPRCASLPFAEWGEMCGGQTSFPQAAQLDNTSTARAARDLFPSSLSGRRRWRLCCFREARVGLCASFFNLVKVMQCRGRLPPKAVWTDRQDSSHEIHTDTVSNSGELMPGLSVALAGAYLVPGAVTPGILNAAGLGALSVCEGSPSTGLRVSGTFRNM